ncbi:hypothetical protein [Helicobacter bilis]|uniref:hypothetical protein n=1 Tax=Helicobacter bilis TaxID=37372 RepID=UPI00248DE876|nr:hypothetical protein [Helicobacter bilis]
MNDNIQKSLQNALDSIKSLEQDVKTSTQEQLQAKYSEAKNAIQRLSSEIQQNANELNIQTRQKAKG